METKDQATSSTSQEPNFSYFGIQSFWGVTKHFGDFPVTKELVKLCHIDQHAPILEVGCGVGITTCYLAGKIGCRVTAVDLSDKMVEWSQGRVKRRGLEARVRFLYRQECGKIKSLTKGRDGLWTLRQDAHPWTIPEA